MDEPTEDRSEYGQGKILGCIKDRRGTPALGGGKPGGHNAPIARKNGGLSKTGKQPENENCRERQGRPKIARECGEKRKERPYDDAEAVDFLRSKSIEQST